VLENIREQLAEPAVTSTVATIGLVGFALHYVLKRKEFTILMGVKALAVGLGYIAALGGVRIWLISFDKSLCDLVKVESQYFFAAGTITVIITAVEIYKQHEEIGKPT
jgi:hypothetical protein